MILTVRHPFGAYQPGDTIPDADVAAILASENASNVVRSGAPDVAPVEASTEPQADAAPEPEPQAVAEVDPASNATPTPEPALPSEPATPVAVSDADPS